MPKKQKKTKEEKIAENYFPVDESDLKMSVEKEEKHPEISAEDIAKTAVEVEYKKPDKDEIEKVEVLALKPKKTKKKSKKTKTAKKTSSSSSAKTSSLKVTPLKSLKEGGYELVITEKPQAALKIASALATSKKIEKKSLNGVPYYEIERNGKKIVIACAVGHLFTLSQNSKKGEFPVFDISWTPNFAVRKNDFTKKYYDAILKLARNAGSLTVATDYDIEGEVIGLNVVRYICGQKDASRMKFSTLTAKELNKAYEEKSPSLNWGQAIAGETRHYLDWFYGINLSRALMNAIKAVGRFKIMSIGRVQGPALNLIVQKEREIQKFKPEPYWQIFITVTDGKNKLELKHNKDIFDKTELSKFENLKGRTAEAKTTKTEQALKPNPPFNLTSLQTEVYKLYGITPSNTLKIAQSLYLAGLISYPRTSSQKLPESIGYKEIVEKLSKIYNAEHLITKDKPLEGSKTDPAHPAIYPTGQNNAALSDNEKKVYDLIVRRFLAVFCDDAIIDNKNVKITIDNLTFTARGSSIRKKAWMEIYPTKLKETSIPDMNGSVEIIDLKIEEKETQPPKRYSPASIVSELEKRNLGTKATRATIIETLYDRGYIKEKSIEATPLGMSLISTLEKYSPIIIDENLTREFENEMESITSAKDNFEEREKEIIQKAKETITKIAQQFQKSEKDIGKELVEANSRLQEQQRKENTLISCPVCKKGNLAITYSKKNKRYFVACNAYPECKTTFSLPPNGTVKKTQEACKECGFPKLMLLKSGKRPWIFCFNPDCITNKERLEEYRKRKEAGEVSK